ncbi:MAG: CcoQ/FixQ family Cbb3-type cytochrome c oxidase assembly chaperone [Bacteroidota bacterium]
MYKVLLQSEGGINLIALIALVIFFVFFAYTTYRTIFAKDSFMDKMSNLPLEEGDASINA